MGRTITAGATQARLPTNQGDTTNDALNAELRREIEELWTATRPKVLTGAHLKRRLADPALATHSRRSEAEAALERLEQEVEAAMQTIGHHWQLISEATCKAMGADGWPQASHGVGFATELLRDIRLGEPYRWAINKGWAA